MNSSLGEECVVLITCWMPFLLPSWPFVLAWPCLCFCLTVRPHMAVHPTHIPDSFLFCKKLSGWGGRRSLQELGVGLLGCDVFLQYVYLFSGVVLFLNAFLCKPVPSVNSVKLSI